MALVVFTGGARSGKSRAAVRLAEELASRGGSVAVAVFGDADGDGEMAARIAHHRSERPEGFAVVEACDSAEWLGRVPEGSALLLDCLGTWLSRAMSDEFSAAAGAHPDIDANEPLSATYVRAVEARADALIETLIGRDGDTIVVTNEVGDGVIPQYPSARLFRDVLGRANRLLVSAADAAYLCVAGRLVDLTALPQTAQWPED